MNNPCNSSVVQTRGKRINGKPRKSSRSGSENSNNRSSNSSSSIIGNSSDSSDIAQSAYDLVRGKCIRCLEPGHRWRECTAYVPSVTKSVPDVYTNRRSRGRDKLCSLSSVLLRMSICSCEEDPIESTEDSGAADSGATYRMARSAGILRTIRPTNDEVGIGDSLVIRILGYGTLTIVLPGNLTVKLLDVAGVPDRSCSLFELMAAHRGGVGFRTEEIDMLSYIFHARPRLERR